jgi:xylulokinase
MQYLLGIDIGTSAVKAALFNTEGSVTAAGVAAYAMYTPQPGWVEQDPNEWWAATAKTVRELIASSGISPGDIAGIGVDGQSWSAVALDGQGDVLCNTPIWMDVRAQKICEDVQVRMGDALFQISKNRFAPSYTTPKILWYQQNTGLYSRIAQVLQSNSWIVYKLTGALTQDISQSYGLHCFDMAKGRYDLETARALGIDLALLPEICACDQVVGMVTAQAAALCGLAEGTPVVAGGLDAAAATLGVGVICPGETQEQGGQAGGMSICTNVCAGDERLILSYHVTPGLWLLQGGSVGGGGVCRWFDREFGLHDFAQLDQEAAAVPPGSERLIFLPYLAGERSPIWNPHAKGVFFGLDYRKTRGHMARAALEGVAFSLRHNLEVAASAGAEASTLHAVGGAVNSRLWTQIKSDVTNHPIHAAQSDHAATLGAAILAGMGTGVFTSYEDAVTKSVRFTQTHKPNVAHKAVYDERYAEYLALYEHLKPMMGGQS